MKTLYRPFFLMILLAGLLSSCVYDKDMAYLNDQNINLNRRVTKLEDAQASLDKTLSNDLDVRLQTIRSGQANTVADMDRLGREIKELSGRIDDNDRIIKRFVERDLGDQEKLKRTVSELAEKVDELEMIVKQQQAYLGLAEKTPAREEGRPVASPGEPRQEEAPVVVQQPPASSETAEYDEALALFRAGKYEASMEGFEAFLKKHPKSDRADNAQFWIGESFMGLKQYEQAILAYQKVIKEYPKGNKTPNAMLRQAMAFLEIKDKTSTRLLLRKIIKTYPKSNEAVIAEKKLKTLK